MRQSAIYRAVVAPAVFFRTTGEDKVRRLFPITPQAVWRYV